MSDYIHIGTKETWGSLEPFGLSPVDSRRHMIVVGQTGSGKTTLLKNLIIQRIEAGHGVGVIDPHGDLTEELLDYIPPRRADDLVYFNPADVEYPIGLNLLARVPNDSRHLVASGIVSSFKSIWRESWGPRMEYILHNALSALLDCENVSLLGLNRLLTDSRYRQWVLKQVKDPVVRSFWTIEFEQYDPRFRREAIAPIQNKLGQFLMNPRIRNILGQVKSKVDLRFMMDTGRILLVNLSKGQLGEEPANLLGSLLTTQIQIAAMSRASLSEEDRRDFHLSIDEFHNFTTDSFAKMLSEVRKYRLCLVLAHQYIAQLSDPVRDAVFGNVGTVISFRVGHADAERLAHEFGNSFPPSSFLDLDRFQMLVKLLENGSTREPFVAASSRPKEQRFNRREMLLKRSREKYATRRSEVEEKIERWMRHK